MSAPSPPQPVTCTRCHGSFLPPTDDPRAIIECPHCLRQAGRSAWAGGRSAALPSPPARGRPAALRAIAGVVVGSAAILGVANWLFFQMRPPVREPETVQAGTAEVRADSAAPPPADATHLDVAYGVARRALASEDWATARPFLRHGARLEPLMKRYHTRYPWVPVTVTGRREGHLVDREGRRWAEISVDTEQGRIIELNIEETPEGWKLDWEALVNAPLFEWEEFYLEKPAEARRLRVSALRGSVPDDYFATAGTSAELSIAVRLFGPNPGDSMIALVPKASDVGRLFQRALTWEVPRRYVCDLRCADPGALPARVDITAFVKEGWEVGP